MPRSLARQRVEPRAEALANGRVQDRLQPLAPRGIGEDDGGDLLAIQAPSR